MEAHASISSLPIERPRVSGLLQGLLRLGLPAACAALGLGALVFFTPGTALHAEDVPTPVAPAGAPDANPSANFGAATPSDKFIQNFQQQVTEQLQSALTQANDAREERLHAYEQQQKDLGEQLQALQQAIASRGMAGGGAPSAGGDAQSDAVEPAPPQVNVRRPSVSEARAEAGIEPAQGGAPAALPGAIAGLLGDALGSAAPGDAQRDAPGGLAGAAAPSEGTMARTQRGSDANISPHGFVQGTLLNGVVAVQGGAERESIVALAGRYRSANNFFVDLDGCFALVQGKPEIGVGRVDFKLSRLTCNFADGSSRTWDTAGWLVDADGIRGVRATIVENASRKAAVAAAGGALGGFGTRLSQQQYQVSTGPLGLGAGAVGAAASSTFIGNAGRDALGGAAAGSANAINQSIGDYYNLYAPSLQVGGGTRVTVVLANELRLPASGREISQTHLALP